MMESPRDSHWLLSLMTDVRGRSEEVKRAIFDIESGEQEDVAAALVMLLITLTCRTGRAHRGLTLPMD